LCGEEDIPYYPIRLVDEKNMLEQYVNLANQETKVTFVGRLATYRYLDMDVTIREAMDVARAFLIAKQNNEVVKPFYVTML
jgi:UDP-galactopyranose mutase